MVHSATEKRQSLRLDKSPRILVTADRGRVRQVLVNLLANAVKFTPPEGSIVVTVGVRSLNGGNVGEISVADSGPGIAEADRAQVFEAYYRTAGTEQVPGVGLGLAISSGLVKQMGGELGLESEVGVGSDFTVRFPLDS